MILNFTLHKKTFLRNNLIFNEVRKKKKKMITVYILYLPQNWILYLEKHRQKKSGRDPTCWITSLNQMIPKYRIFSISVSSSLHLAGSNMNITYSWYTFVLHITFNTVYFIHRWILSFPFIHFVSVDKISLFSH